MKLHRPQGEDCPVLYPLFESNEALGGKSVKELLPLELQLELQAGYLPPLFFERELDLAEEMRVFKTALETYSLKITYSANLSSYAKIQMGFGSEFRQSVLYRRAHPVLCCKMSDRSGLIPQNLPH